MTQTESRKRLPVGIEDFTEILTSDFYYVDKTVMIRDLLCHWGKVNLFTRPRRFGKSLNMSMLRCFFEIGGPGTLFDSLAISRETDLCEKYRNCFPVISISLKSVNGSDFTTARSVMSAVIGYEALRFRFLLDSSALNEEEKKLYRQLITVDEASRDVFFMSDAVLMGSLRTLSFLLHKHFRQKVILLIDEYDAPLAKAEENGYYESMILLVRSLYEQTFKTNDSLYFAVLTGCLRIARESIFTGMNNLKVFSLSDVRFDEYFGFTDREVREMLRYYDRMEKYEEIKEWYNGYCFGRTEIYCPWDVINYCDECIADPSVLPKNYWSNTSGNEIVSRFIEKAETKTARREIENLIAGEVIHKEIHPELTYRDLYDSFDHLWSILFTTGYLTQRGAPDGDIFALAIPNREIRKIFTIQIMKLFKEQVGKDGKAIQAFCEALKNGETEKVEQKFTDYLKRTVSIRDTFSRTGMKENFYHGILLGILSFKETWEIASNKEAGEGYSDIQIEIEEEEIGIIIEVKYAPETALAAQCQAALEQICRKDYARQLREDGMRTILKYGIACCRKKCKAALQREPAGAGESV